MYRYDIIKYICRLRVVFVRALMAFFEKFNLSSLSVPSIRATDIIDILLVAVLIYIIITWIKETRAWSLFKGIIVIIMISLLSYNFNLYTISWVIEKTLNVGIIAIIVLFQPEFRKGLEKIGKKNIVIDIFSSDKEEKNNIKTIEEIITACFKMSETKTGALILIEQDVALGDFEENGILIDAVVTSQLLINIFVNKTPLHDGAVLVRDNRVASAACILPLTSTEIGLDLGTRHRAAIGASEVSDAYVLVVSEETGNVSIAHGGHLYKRLSPEKVRKILIHETPSRKRNIWKGGKKDEK